MSKTNRPSVSSFKLFFCLFSLLASSFVFATGIIAQVKVEEEPAQEQAEAEAETEQTETDVTSEPDDSAVRKQVFKIYSSRRSPSLSRPWRRGEIREATGSGVWLGDGRVLTNAHVVLYSSQIYVQPFDSSDRISAEVESISPEMDLAVLKLEDSDNKFSDMVPMSLMQQLPELRSAVQAYGYPAGGSAISVTEGVVSRIEFTNYSYGEAGLRIQIDAGINPGNSGGPALVDGKIAGLVYSRLQSGDNIGYLIPAEEIAAFMEDVKDGSFDGKPKVRDAFQKLQNDALRQRFKLTSDQTGVVVGKASKSDEEYPLKADDVMTHIGPHNIDNEGMVRLDSGIRLGFTYFIPKVIKDGKFPATIVRSGETMSVDVPAGPRPAKVMRALKNEYPKYFVYGPIVFVEATSDYLDSLRRLNSTVSTARVRAVFAMMELLIARESPLITRRNDEPEFEGEELVIVPVPLLPHKISKGYTAPTAKVLSKINGERVKNLKHLVALLRDMKDEQVKFEFADRDAPYLVFNRKEIEKAMEDILVDNSIARQGSKELLREWNKSDD